MYEFLKQFLFKMNAEKAHQFTFQLLRYTQKHPELLHWFFQKPLQANALKREFFGLQFPNPVGLAAGLDKNAEAIDTMAALGFGFVEIGTITPKPQPGNEKPRLFRLVEDKALINRMGFNNVGADLAAARLARRKSDVIVGANIGKNKVTPNEEAYKDYEICFNTLFDLADYFVVNVSSPNTPGLRALQDKDALTKILGTLQNINMGKANPKPLLLKIAPDLTETQIQEVAEVAKTTQLSGIVATNTTISRAGLSTSKERVEQIGAGGLSGAPLTELATEKIKILVAALKAIDYQIPVVGVGGIMNAEDARGKLDAGAQLIQIYTGFIYKGPALIREINRLFL